MEKRKLPIHPLLLLGIVFILPLLTVTVYYRATLNLPSDDTALVIAIILGVFVTPTLLAIWAIRLLFRKREVKSRLLSILLCTVCTIGFFVGMTFLEPEVYDAVLASGQVARLDGTWQGVTHTYDYASGRPSEPFTVTLTLSTKDKSYTIQWLDKEYSGPARISGQSFTLERPGAQVVAQARYSFDGKSQMRLDPVSSDPANPFLYRAVTSTSQSGNSLITVSSVVVWEKVE